MNPALNGIGDTMCLECANAIEIMTDPGLYMYVDSLCMTYVVPYTLYGSVHIQTQGEGCLPIPSSYRTCARAVPHCDPPVPIHNGTVCYYTGGTLNLFSCTCAV